MLIEHARKPGDFDPGCQTCAGQAGLLDHYDRVQREEARVQQTRALARAARPYAIWALVSSGVEILLAAVALLSGMSRPAGGAGPAERVHYELRIQGCWIPRWSAWFGGLEVTCDQAGQTTNAGLVTDAALHGLLAKIRDLGLPLLEVHRPITAEESG